MFDFYLRQRGYREYDATISLRITSDFYRLIKNINRSNYSFFLRALIRNDYNPDYHLVLDNLDYHKVIKSIKKDRLECIKSYNYRYPKIHRVSFKIYEEEKEKLIEKSKNNINDYMEMLFLDFVNKALTEGGDMDKN